MKKLLLALVIGCSMSVSASYAKDTKPTQEQVTQIHTLVDTIAERHNVPKDLAHAIVSLESNYNPNVTGKLGEIGLGQIRCKTAKTEGFKGKCTELYNPEVNLEYSMSYLRYALDLTNNDICKAASFYSSGQIPRSNKTAYCRKMLTHLQ
jgi:soluble lytic murein transglycosylase-like protein